MSGLHAIRAFFIMIWRKITCDENDDYEDAYRLMEKDDDVFDITYVLDRNEMSSESSYDSSLSN